MSDLWASIVRTAVPYIVGGIVSWLVGLGLSVDASLEGTLTAVFTFVFGTVYYLAVRALEKKWPALGVLLGVPVQPTYTATTTKQ